MQLPVAVLVSKLFLLCEAFYVLKTDHRFFFNPFLSEVFDCC